MEVELDAKGRATEPTKVSADPAHFVGNAGADWAIIRLAPGSTEGRAHVPFATVEAEEDDWVAIIQHPNGLPKQIALHRNTVAYAGAQFVQYLTDTLPGSSGSPVFNDHWEVIALHHAGGDLPLPGTGSTVFRNQGITISRVLAGLKEHNVEGAPQ